MSIKVLQDHRAMTFQEATDLLGLPLERVAEATGKSYATIVAYRRGDRVPPPEVLAIVARLMREQSGELEGAARQLELHVQRAKMLASDEVVLLHNALVRAAEKIEAGEIDAARRSLIGWRDSKDTRHVDQDKLEAIKRLVEAAVACLAGPKPGTARAIELLDSAINQLTLP